MHITDRSTEQEGRGAEAIEEGGIQEEQTGPLRRRQPEDAAGEAAGTYISYAENLVLLYSNIVPLFVAALDPDKPVVLLKLLTWAYEVTHECVDTKIVEGVHEN